MKKTLKFKNGTLCFFLIINFDILIIEYISSQSSIKIIQINMNIAWLIPFQKIETTHNTSKQ